MSNGIPTCDPPCQKILLDGDLLEHLATCLCDHVTQYREHGGAYGNPEHVIKAINAAEDATVDALKVILKEQGYTGPLPKMLQ